ncbi:unnamed protein product [Diamesa serratosioi]
MNANFLRTKNYKAQLNLQQIQQVDNQSFPNSETNATTSYSNDEQKSKWNKYEQSQDSDNDPHESNRLKRLNDSCRTNEEHSNNPDESGQTIKKSKWSDFIDDGEDDMDFNQLNELDKPS